jgi:hypothetical protein
MNQEELHNPKLNFSANVYVVCNFVLETVCGRSNLARVLGLVGQVLRPTEMTNEFLDCSQLSRENSCFIFRSTGVHFSVSQDKFLGSTPRFSSQSLSSMSRLDCFR